MCETLASISCWQWQWQPHIKPYAAYLVVKSCHFRQEFLNINFQFIQSIDRELVIDNATVADTYVWCTTTWDENEIGWSLVDGWKDFMYHFYQNHDETTDCPHHCYHNHCPITDEYVCCALYITYFQTIFYHLIKISKDSLNALNYVKN